MGVGSLDCEHSLKYEIATHLSILAWKFPWTEECAGLQSFEWQSRTQLSTQTPIRLRFRVSLIGTNPGSRCERKSESDFSVQRLSVFLGNHLRCF